MCRATLQTFAALAADKSAYLRRNPVGFFVSAMLAGAYIGAGIALIFALGHPLEPAWRPLVMGAAFGIALTLVVFAGAELFTGYVMSMTIGVLAGSVSVCALLVSWLVTWGANLLGALMFSFLVVAGGAAVAISGVDFIQSVALHKMNGSAMELVARAMLCNWLVCLALWMCARTQNDAAKCVLIFWCLFAFIACGFEHAIANMTIFGISAFAGGVENLNLAGISHNLLWVTVGNILSGSLFLGVAYWVAGGGVVYSVSRDEA